MAFYDVIGNIAIVKSEGKSRAEVQRVAKELLARPNIKTVVEKAERFKGRLRTIKVKHLLGEKNTIAEYKENGCVFLMDVEKAYFSSRLSNERLEVAGKIKKKDSVLVLFSGVGPFSVVIAKKIKPKRLVSIELGRIPHKFALENAVKNKIAEDVEFIQGDVKRQIPKLKEKFDVIVMPRPNLKETFLKDALKVSKKGTKIIYYGFCRDDEVKDMVQELKDEAVEVKKKIRVLKVKQAGDIAPYKHRYRVEIRVE